MRIIIFPSFPAPSTLELWVGEMKQERGKESMECFLMCSTCPFWEEKHRGRDKILCGGG